MERSGEGPPLNNKEESATGRQGKAYVACKEVLFWWTSWVRWILGACREWGSSTTADLPFCTWTSSPPIFWWTSTGDAKSETSGYPRSLTGCNPAWSLLCPPTILAGSPLRSASLLSDPKKKIQKMLLKSAWISTKLVFAVRALFLHDLMYELCPCMILKYDLRMRAIVLQVLEHGRISPAADVYSFGIVLWELLTWSIPWEDEKPFQV